VRLQERKKCIAVSQQLTDNACGLETPLELILASFLTSVIADVLPYRTPFVQLGVLSCELLVGRNLARGLRAILCYPAI